jgi:hypothetical protein
MASAQVNYKLERAAEAVEDLAVAVAVSVRDAPNGADNVSNARKELRDALAEFLAPTLRVVGDNET